MACILFKTEANSQIGSGHFQRCLILADALTQKSQMQIGFILSNTPESLHLTLLDKGYHVLTHPFDPENESINICRRFSEIKEKKNLLIIDSDQPVYYDPYFQRTIISNDIILFHITFMHRESYYSHIIANQNLLSKYHQYSVQDYTRKLLGPDYAVLQPSFLKLRSKGLRFNETVRTILISFGGADRHNVTLKVLKKLHQLQTDAQIIVVVGMLYEHISLLKKAIDDFSNIEIKLFQNTQQMPELMYQADLAITSGGLTSWELACLGVPNVIISTSSREALSAELLHREGYALYIGHHEQIEDVNGRLDILSDEKLRFQFHQKSSLLVDGMGTQRIVSEIEKWIVEKSVPNG